MQCIVFVLSEVSCFKLLFRLFIRLLKLFQLSLSLFNLSLQEFLLLRQKFRIGGVQLQELFNVLQAPLRAVYIFLDIF